MLPGAEAKQKSEAPAKHSPFRLMLVQCLVYMEDKPPRAVFPFLRNVFVVLLDVCPDAFFPILEVGLCELLTDVFLFQALLFLDFCVIAKRALH